MIYFHRTLQLARDLCTGTSKPMNPVPSTTHRHSQMLVCPCDLMSQSLIDRLGSYMIGSTFLKLLPTAHLHLRRDLSPETSKNTYPVAPTSYWQMLLQDIKNPLKRTPYNPIEPCPAQFPELHEAISTNAQGSNSCPWS